jgi:hypothetical protein
MSSRGGGNPYVVIVDHERINVSVKEQLEPVESNGRALVVRIGLRKSMSE